MPFTEQSDQNRLEAELDFIRGQQGELELLLAPLEAAVAEPGGLATSTLHQGDRQRDNMYHLAQVRGTIETVIEITCITSLRYAQVQHQ